MIVRVRGGARVEVDPLPIEAVVIRIAMVVARDGTRRAQAVLARVVVVDGVDRDHGIGITVGVRETGTVVTGEVGGDEANHQPLLVAVLENHPVATGNGWGTHIRSTHN